jgi:fumarate hydratase subunit beta
MIHIDTPINPSVIRKLKIGDEIEIYGKIYAGRDAVLPKICQLINENRQSELGVDLFGSVIFHTAVTAAGIGPTTSGKVEIEGSIPLLSKAGVKLHLGKGALQPRTVKELNRWNSVFAVTPPVSAVFHQSLKGKRVVAFPEEGMEAFFELIVEKLPAIIAVAHGKSIFSKF